MAFESIAGGFKLSAADRDLVNSQRSITKQINDRLIQVGAVFLKTSSKNPNDEDWSARKHLDTNLQSWIDDEDKQYFNTGFNLQLGWVDVDIDAADGTDPDFNECIVEAMNALQVDTRFKFGRLSVGAPTHVFVQLGDDESANWDYLEKFEPKEFRLDGKRYHVQLRSSATNTTAVNLARTAKQTVMPGSIYTHKTRAHQYDISVWWTNGKPADDVRKVAATTPRKVNFNNIVRSITFGVFARVLRDHWTEGNRQVIAQKIGGWLARVVKDSQAMNNHEAIASDVFCPVDDDAMAERLIGFVCDLYGDPEKHMRIRAYHDAVKKLARNPDAKIPGWPAIEQLLGGEAAVALRTVFMPGSDVSQLTKMAERYVYDESDDSYIDRDRFLSGSNFVHDGDGLFRRHKGDVVRIGGKPREAFRVFESSDMRKRVGFREFYPELSPGQIYRISPIGEVLSDEDENGAALATFNTWRGWPIGPAAVVEPDYLNDLVARLDKVLGWLTQDNRFQIDWIKKWIAWTFQNPGLKQQIAWVVVGEQGIGKSWIGNIFMKALMGSLWGSASPKVLEGDFNVGPFKEKMFVFIDEAKFQSDVGVDEIKKLIRGVDVAGMEKFQEARNYRLHARIMFASNRVDMGIGQANTRDRALFYTKAYDREYTHKTELEFRAWAETLKPFFADFTDLINTRKAREHFMHYFLTLETDRFEVESTHYSSSGDPGIVMANMSWPRRIAKFIIEEGRIFDDLDITYPFTITDLNRRVGELSLEMGLRNVAPARVMAEFQTAGIVETVVISGQKKMRMTHKLGTLTELFGAAISVKLESRFEFTEEDFGVNECDGKSSRPKWRGANQGIVQERF